MENHLIWLIGGLVLIIAELASGTFYLLVLGIAALLAAAVGYFGGSPPAQAFCASVVAVIGVVAVNRWRRNQPKSTGSANNMDIGQPVVFEAWTNEAARLMRVQYRGATWDAQLVGDAHPTGDAHSIGKPGPHHDPLYICGAQGSRLQVSRSRPA